MTTIRKLIIAFWILVGIMLLWTAYNYNHTNEVEDAAAPQDQHFYFVHSTKPGAVAPVQSESADVRQTQFKFKDNVPGAGNTTYFVTLTNKGKAKATDVQILVRPFKGASNYDDNVGQSDSTPLADTDPISQIGTWVTFPDLAPGESSTQTVIFLTRSYNSAGKNADPQIAFKSAPKSAGH